MFHMTLYAVVAVIVAFIMLFAAFAHYYVLERTEDLNDRLFRIEMRGQDEAWYRRRVNGLRNYYGYRMSSYVKSDNTPLWVTEIV